MPGELARDWTLEELAARCGMSAEPVRPMHETTDEPLAVARHPQLCRLETAAEWLFSQPDAT